MPRLRSRTVGPRLGPKEPRTSPDHGVFEQPRRKRRRKGRACPPLPSPSGDKGRAVTPPWGPHARPGPAALDPFSGDEKEASSEEEEKRSTRARKPKKKRKVKEGLNEKDGKPTGIGGNRKVSLTEAASLQIRECNGFPSGIYRQSSDNEGSTRFNKRRLRLSKMKYVESPSLEQNANEAIHSITENSEEQWRERSQHFCNHLPSTEVNSPVGELQGSSRFGFHKDAPDGNGLSYKIGLGNMGLGQDAIKVKKGNVAVKEKSSRRRNPLLQTEEAIPETSTAKLIEGNGGYGKVTYQGRNSGLYSCFDKKKNKHSKEAKRNTGRKRRKRVKWTEKIDKLAFENNFSNVNRSSELVLHKQKVVCNEDKIAKLKDKGSHLLVMREGGCNTLSNSYENVNPPEEYEGKNNHTSSCLGEIRTKHCVNVVETTPELSEEKKSGLKLLEGRNRKPLPPCTFPMVRLPFDTFDYHRDFSDYHRVAKSTSGETEELKLSCRRTVPMTGQRIWPCNSCARTSVWCHKSGIFQVQIPSESEKTLCQDNFENYNANGCLLTDRSMAEPKKESTSKVKLDCTSFKATPDIASVTSVMDMKMPLLMSRAKNVDSSENICRNEQVIVSQASEDDQLMEMTLNLTVDKKRCGTKNKGVQTNNPYSLAFQDKLCINNSENQMINQKTSAKQTLTVPDLMKTSNAGRLSNFKIPFLKNKMEPRSAMNVKSQKRETCSPLELLDNFLAVEMPQARKKESTSLLSSNQESINIPTRVTLVQDSNNQICGKNPARTNLQGLPKQTDFKPSYQKSLFACPGGEAKTGNCESIPLAFDADCSKGNDAPDSSSAPYVLDSYHSSEEDRVGKKSYKRIEKIKVEFPDIRQAYEEDVLVIDVIQDDPDLFGGLSEDELPLTSDDISEDPQNLNMSEEHRVTETSKNLLIQQHGKVKSEMNVEASLPTANNITYDSSLGQTVLRGLPNEMVEDEKAENSNEYQRDSNMYEKGRFSGRVFIKEEKESIHEEENSKDVKYAEIMANDHQVTSPYITPPNLAISSMTLNSHQDDTILKPWINDFRFPEEHPFLILPNSESREIFQRERSAIFQKSLGLTALPPGYCKFYFNTLRGCERLQCKFGHVPEQGDEKVCMEILKKYVNINEPCLLRRAVNIFVDFYGECPPGIYFDLQVLNDLLLYLLDHGFLKKLFQVVNISIMIKMLPAIKIFLKVFEYVASMNLKYAIPSLVDTLHKLIEAGMVLDSENFNYVISVLHQLQASKQHINAILEMKSRLRLKQFSKSWIYDLDLAIAEIKHCKEKGDWTTLGNLYMTIRMKYEKFSDLKRFSVCTAEMFTEDCTKERPDVVPFCEFAETVGKDLQNSGIDKTFLGRIGINVMYAYHKSLQWTKGRKVLDKLLELQIHFTTLKGLTGPEMLAPRCQIVNIAAEIFLKCGSLDGAIWVLREWIINTPTWPCDRVDVLMRHNLLCKIAHQALAKNLFRQTFEVLQNLPGFHNPQENVEVKQYSRIFNKLLRACVESNSLGISSSVAEFMVSKIIPVDFAFLRRLITALGRSCLWLKARAHYKSALSLGCYPTLEGNLYRKLLLIPSYLSEVEMLLAIEIFLVSNANSIQNPGASAQTLQIVLKRCEEGKVRSNDDYRAATERLIQAARISDPKLFIKHTTVNVTMEQVYSLERCSALKWLKENLQWAGKVWLCQ
ncbi:protein TOPAZ1 isoform X2 [Tachyglossus aculeatus]|uniref:protein TOPAZ1 isoform X2 n=1 Tax=Tachyglossus aculeatus TaxID=9261 RepID=UPI0018F5D351|nr:protein TOPAZ1 isoform X2 [Tachyglossus aculeatus]